MPVEPLYARIANQLLELISSGVYAVGDLLPTEIELAQQLKVSRHTLRAALDQLEKDGRISRRKNVGTRVEPLRTAVYSQSLGTVDELIQWANRCQRQIQSTQQVVMNRAMAAQLGCEAGSTWLSVTSLRFDDAKQSTPVALTQAYIDERYQSILPLMRKHPGALIADLLVRKFGLNLPVIEQKVQAVPLSAQMMKTLNVSDEAVGLEVIRKYLNPTQNPVLITRSTHAASRFALHMRLERKPS